jgi:hypothetical protein
MKAIQILILAFMVLNILDFSTTLVNLQLGNQEGNPLMAWLIENTLSGYIILKVFVPTLVGFFFLAWLKRNEDRISFKAFSFTRIALFFVVMIYLLIVINNSVYLVEAEIIEESDIYVASTMQSIGTSDTTQNSLYSYSYSVGLPHNVVSFAYQGDEVEYIMIRAIETNVLGVANFLCDGANYYTSDFVGTARISTSDDGEIGSGSFMSYMDGSKRVIEFFLSNVDWSKVSQGERVYVGYSWISSPQSCAFQSIYSSKSIMDPNYFSHSNTTDPLIDYSIQVNVHYRYSSYAWYGIFSGASPVELYKLQHKLVLSGHFKYYNNSINAYYLNFTNIDPASYIYYNTTEMSYSSDKVYENVEFTSIYPFLNFTLETPSGFKYHHELPYSESMIPESQNLTITFYFIDVSTGSLINDVNMLYWVNCYEEDELIEYCVNQTIVTADSGFSIEVPYMSQIFWEVDKDGYIEAESNIGGLVNIQEDQEVILEFIPLNTTLEDPVNNTALIFHTFDNRTYDYLGGVYITISYNGQSETKITNDQGYTAFEVPKNTTITYLAKKSGYFPFADSIYSGVNNTVLQVGLYPQVNQSWTPGENGTGIGVTPTPISGTETSSTGPRGMAEAVINEAYEYAPQLFTLIMFFLFIAVMERSGAFRRR